MIGWVRGWLRAKPLRGGVRPGSAGRTTRRRLESGLKHFETARSRSRDGAVGGAEYVEAIRSYGDVIGRHPEMTEALEGKAASLCDLALLRMECQIDSPPEWTAAVVTFGRVLASDPRRVTAYRGRAALYLAAAVRLKSREASDRHALEQAQGDLSLALSLAPQDPGVRALDAILRTLWTSAGGPPGSLPSVRLVRESWTGHPTLPGA